MAALLSSTTPMTPAQVRDALADDLAYTTVMTVLARLNEKGQIRRERAGRAYAYRPVPEGADRTAVQMRRLLDADDDRAAVLSRFVDVLDPDDEAVLAELLRRADGGPQP